MDDINTNGNERDPMFEGFKTDTGQVKRALEYAVASGRYVKCACGTTISAECETCPACLGTGKAVELRTSRGDGRHNPPRKTK